MKIALVLEGGGMRGCFTAGVIDSFIKNNIIFNTCYGVSAGAINGCSYVTRQYGRAIKILVDYVDDKRYGGIHHFLRTGEFLNYKFFFHTISLELEPIDLESFKNSTTNLIVTLTNVNTGLAEYYPIKDIEKDMDMVQASSSLPVVARFVLINGNYYLDGGLADSIPVKKAFDDGFDKVVAVLTNHRGFVKKPQSMKLIKTKYHNYPNLVTTISKRHVMYNDTLKYIYEAEKQGKCFIIQPKNPVVVKRLDKDKEKLMNLYEEGVSQAESLMKDLVEFMKG